IFTWFTIDKTDTIILYAFPGQQIEAVLPNIASSTILSQGFTSITAKISNTSLIITGSPSVGSTTFIKSGSTSIIIADKFTARTFWNPKIDTNASPYDVAPDVASVFISDPCLVRNASISTAGSILNILGDLNQTTRLEVLAPAAVTNITWNGVAVVTSATPQGTLKGTLSFTLKVPTLQLYRFVAGGLEEAGTSDAHKTPRGIRRYQLLGGGDFDTWKIIGNFGGEAGPDIVRGNLNEGGLFVERQGTHLPGYSTQNNSWTTGSTCNPLTTDLSAAGIKAFRASFNLNFPAGSDIPVALSFTRTFSSRHRSVIYVNGWQLGRFSSADGPQTLFLLPDGILNSSGNNTLLITLWSLDTQGAKFADIELVSTALVQSSKTPLPGNVSIVPAIMLKPIYLIISEMELGTAFLVY
ncbi:hypothetical protein M422DRAFT_258174, partial [Sphaerobolus stellatus SS14]